MRACGCVVLPLTSIVTARNNANKRASESWLVLVEHCLAFAAGNMARSACSGAGSNRIACPLKVRWLPFFCFKCCQVWVITQITSKLFIQGAIRLLTRKLSIFWMFINYFYI